MGKIKQTWRLPPPIDEGDEYIWHPVVRVGRVVPWGYEQDPEDQDILNPIPEELILLEAAKKYLKKYSSREVAAWLSERSGRPISHTGLINRVKLEARRKTQVADARYWAERYRQAAEKAEKLERSRIGARDAKDSSDTSD